MISTGKSWIPTLTQPRMCLDCSGQSMSVQWQACVIFFHLRPCALLAARILMKGDPSLWSSRRWGFQYDAAWQHKEGKRWKTYDKVKKSVSVNEHAIWSFGLSYVVLFGSSMECGLFAPRSPFLCPTRRVIEEGFAGLTCFCVHPIPPTLHDLNAFGILMPLWLSILCPLCLLFDVLNWNFFLGGYFISFIV